MRVPTRKPGKYALEKPDYHLTQEAYDQLGRELIKLEKKVRPRLIEEMQSAAAHGDFSENAAYQIAKGKLRGLNNKILEINRQLNLAVIIEPGSAGGRIKIGSTVTVEANGQKKVYQILGAQEADPPRGKISHLSPLGALLIGHQVGEKVILKTDQKKIEYEIIEVK